MKKDNGLKDLREEVELLGEKLELLQQIKEVQEAIDALGRVEVPIVYPYYPPLDTGTKITWTPVTTWSTNKTNFTGELYARNS